jgi:hypothetical protein
MSIDDWKLWRLRMHQSIRPQQRREAIAALGVPAFSVWGAFGNT